MNPEQPWSDAACVAFAEFRIAASSSFDTAGYPMSVDPRARAIERRLRDEAKP